MKQAEIYHPRIFSDQDWAEGYYKRNSKNIEQVGRRFVGLLQKSGFEGGRILDTGCGFGAVPVEIAKSFNNVEIIGIDLAEPLLNMAESLAEQCGVADSIRFIEGDVYKLDFESDSFDVVINSFMIHIVEEPITMLNEIERVANSEARILITDLRRNWLGLFVKKLKTAYTLEEGVDVIKKSNIRYGRFSKGPFWWDYMVGV
jgi:ubiquinone/menaquinone biosynthesis C-methylase UbiE